MPFSFSCMFPVFPGDGGTGPRRVGRPGRGKRRQVKAGRKAARRQR